MLLEAVWILAAIELNGATVSRGAMVRLTPTHCEVEHSALDSHLNPTRSDHRHSSHWSFAAKHCSVDTALGILRMQLPQELLATRRLLLGPTSRQSPIALLHGVAPQEPVDVRVLPSASVDLMVGSSFHGLGLGVSAGPWLFHSLAQQTEGEPTGTRWAIEYLGSSGAGATLGDFRAELGLTQRFGEFRGVHLTNRVAPLRNDASAFGELVIDRPTRLQFFDRQGIPIYSAELLSPGNYQIQGYGASSVPGFLEARLVDSLGRTQVVSIPWTADRKLLQPNTTLWEIILARASINSRSSSSAVLATAPVVSAQLRHGLDHRHSLGLHLAHSANSTEWSGEISSRSIPNLLATLGLGRQCGPMACKTAWLGDARLSLGRSAQLVANLQQGDTKTATLGLSTSFHARGSGSWQWSRQTRDSLETVDSSQSSTTSTHTLSIRWRLLQELSLQLQARHQERDGRTSWSGLIGLTTNWTKERTSVSGYWGRQGGGSFSSSARDGATVQINRSSHGLYGTQLSATHRQDETTRSDLFIRHASPFGDASLRMETTGNQPQWSASTRLWVTHDDVFFAPLGDDNLVIQDIGKPLIQISQPGRDTQRSNAKGIAVFKKVPAWSEASYTIDLKSLPFDLQLASHRVAVPLASRRVYRIGHANQWSTHLEWVLEGVDLKTIHVSHHALTRQGRAALINDDGFVDLRGAHELPLRLTPKSPQGAGSIGPRDTFDCTERNLPGILSCRRSDVLTRLPNPASQQID